MFFIKVKYNVICIKYWCKLSWNMSGCPSLIKYPKVLNLAQWISVLLYYYYISIVWIYWMGRCMAIGKVSLDE